MVTLTLPDRSACGPQCDYPETCRLAWLYGPQPGAISVSSVCLCGAGPLGSRAERSAFGAVPPGLRLSFRD